METAKELLQRAWREYHAGRRTHAKFYARKSMSALGITADLREYNADMMLQAAANTIAAAEVK